MSLLRADIIFQKATENSLGEFSKAVIGSKLVMDKEYIGSAVFLEYCLQ